MRVDFFSAGTQKAATTALDASLRRHPSLQMARVKEVHFFDDESVDWRAPDYAALRAQFHPGPRCAASRRRSTCIGRIRSNASAAYNPSAKIIVALRHPAFRAHSQWRMETTRGYDTSAFSAATREGRARVRAAPGGVHRVFSYVERGYYDEQIARLLALFPRDQAHFLRTDDLFAEPQASLASIERFLGVPHQGMGGVGYVVPRVSGKGAAMSAEDRALLDAQFSPRYAAIERPTGLDLSDWRNPGYADPMQAG